MLLLNSTVDAYLCFQQKHLDFFVEIVQKQAA